MSIRHFKYLNMWIIRAFLVYLYNKKNMQSSIMSDFVVYLKLEPYLSQWLHHHLGDPVRFPDGSNENAVIRRFLMKLPPGKKPDLAADNLTAICIPDSKAKPCTRFNHLGPRGKLAVKGVIEDLFRQNLWCDLRGITDAGSLSMKIQAWCEMHGIDEQSHEAIRQKYYRMRKAYSEKGIFLVHRRAKRTDN